MDCGQLSSDLNLLASSQCLQSKNLQGLASLADDPKNPKDEMLARKNSSKEK